MRKKKGYEFKLDVTAFKLTLCRILLAEEKLVIADLDL